MSGEDNKSSQINHRRECCICHSPSDRFLLRKNFPFYEEDPILRQSNDSYCLDCYVKTIPDQRAPKTPENIKWLREYFNNWYVN